MGLPRRRVRVLIVLFGVFALALGGWLGLRWLAFREWLRCEISYTAENVRLEKDYERRIRDVIAQIRQGDERDPGVEDLTDRAFEMLRISFVADNSKEVDAWRVKPYSPERTAVALKWAEFAADEAAFQARLNEIWLKDLRRGRMPRHIFDAEVPPLPMPAGWTADDWKWSNSNATPSPSAAGGEVQ